MDRKEFMMFITNIDNEIVGELNERFNDCVVNGICDYDKGIITIEVAEPFEDTEEVEEIIELALPFDYETNYTIEDYTITITIGRELNEWEQDMKEYNYEDIQEQYYANERFRKMYLSNEVDALLNLYTTQPFAVEIQNDNTVQGFYLRKKKEVAEQLKRYIDEFNQLIDEEEEQSMK